MRTVVVLPAPLWPRSENTSPSARRRVTDREAPRCRRSDARHGPAGWQTRGVRRRSGKTCARRVERVNGERTLGIQPTERVGPARDRRPRWSAIAETSVSRSPTTTCVIRRARNSASVVSASARKNPIAGTPVSHVSTRGFMKTARIGAESRAARSRANSGRTPGASISTVGRGSRELA